VISIREHPRSELAQHRTRSGWRTHTSPGGDGYSEFMIDDTAGAELVNIQAERDLTRLVKNDESVVVGNNLDAITRANESFTVGQNQTISVGAGRRVRVGTEDTLEVGKRRRVSIGPSPRPLPTCVEMVDGRIVLSTGAGATITLDGDEVTIRASKIHLHGDKEVTGKVDNGDLKLLGGPMVKVNC
jgi:type VI secretion system secreted protein VgrG